MGRKGKVGIKEERAWRLHEMTTHGLCDALEIFGAVIAQREVHAPAGNETVS